MKSRRLCGYNVNMVLFVLNLVLVYSLGYGQGTTTGVDPDLSMNYIRMKTPQVDGLYTADDVNSVTDIHQLQQITTYYDGLGRPFQVVNRQLSPNYQDIITAQDYDAFGRQYKQYLP